MPSLKKLLGGLPIAGMKEEVNNLVGTLKKTSCRGGLTRCSAAKSGPMQLYFFTSGTSQQTFLLVLNKTMALTPLLKPNVQKVLAQTSVSDSIISLSTTDYVLDIAGMPADLRKIVEDSYFNVPNLTCSSGVEMAARAIIGGVMMTILTDLASGAGSGTGLADAMHHGDTMQKAGSDAMRPTAFVEFQPTPGLKIPMTAPALSLTDATFFIDNELVFGYKGKARMATLQAITLTDTAYIAMAMTLPQVAIPKSGGAC